MLHFLLYIRHRHTNSSPKHTCYKCIFSRSCFTHQYKNSTQFRLYASLIASQNTNLQSSNLFYGRNQTETDLNALNNFGGYYISSTNGYSNLPEALKSQNQSVFVLVFGQYSGKSGRFCQLLTSDTGAYCRRFNGVNFLPWTAL